MEHGSRGHSISKTALTKLLLLLSLPWLLGLAGCRETGVSSDVQAAQPASASPSAPVVSPAKQPAVSPDEELLSFGQVVPKCKRICRGDVEDCLVFHYTMREAAGDEAIRVELPASEAAQERKRRDWECVFCCYRTNEQPKQVRAVKQAAVADDLWDFPWPDSLATNAGYHLSVGYSFSFGGRSDSTAGIVNSPSGMYSNGGLNYSQDRLGVIKVTGPNGEAVVPYAPSSSNRFAEDDAGPSFIKPSVMSNPDSALGRSYGFSP